MREILEELGEAVEVQRHLWTIENLFEWKGKQVHEIGLYFQCRLRAGSMLLTEPGPYAGVEGGDPLTFAWFEQPSLSGIVVHPPVLGQLLAHAEPVPGHHVQQPWPRPAEAR